MTNWNWNKSPQGDRPTPQKQTMQWPTVSAQPNPVSPNTNPPPSNNRYVDALASINAGQKFELKPIHWGIGGAIALLGLVLATGGAGDIKEMNERGQQLSSERQSIQDRNNALKLAQIEAEQAQAIANARYEAGCIIVVATSDNKTLVSIIEGKPVKDGMTGGNLPNKSVVCDNQGNTGIIENGVVAHTAFTGDRQTVIDAMKAQGWTFTDSSEPAETSKPGQGDGVSNNFGG